MANASVTTLALGFFIIAAVVLAILFGLSMTRKLPGEKSIRKARFAVRGDGPTTFEAAIERVRTGDALALIVSRAGCPHCETLARLQSESTVPYSASRIIRMDVQELTEEEAMKKVEGVPAVFTLAPADSGFEIQKSHGPFTQESVDAMNKQSMERATDAGVLPSLTVVRSSVDALKELDSMEQGMLAIVAMDCGPSRMMNYMMQASALKQEFPKHKLVVLRLDQKSLPANDEGNDELTRRFEEASTRKGIYSFPSWIAKTDAGVRGGAGFNPRVKSPLALIMGLLDAPAEDAKNDAPVAACGGN